MLKEILTVSGKPGLYKLISQSTNLTIVESLIDKKRMPVHERVKMNVLSNIFIFTDGAEVPMGEVYASIKEKENGGKISIDLSQAQPDELRAYLAEVLPNFDRQRVYPNDIKKMLKWYDLLIENDITDFSTKEEEKPEKENEAVEPEADPEEKEAKQNVKAKTGTTTATRKGTLQAIPSTKAAKVKSTPKTSTPKRSVVGAKRGS